MIVTVTRALTTQFPTKKRIVMTQMILRSCTSPCLGVDGFYDNASQQTTQTCVEDGNYLILAPKGKVLTNFFTELQKAGLSSAMNKTLYIETHRTQFCIYFIY